MGANGSTEASGGYPGGTDAGAAKAPVDGVIDRVSLSKQAGAVAIEGRYSTTQSLADHYKVTPKVVGSGMSGPVQLATGIKDQRKYAVKSFKKKGLPSKKLEELKNEVEIYLKLDHPHVARLDMVFENNDEIDLVMEFMAGGELYDRLSSKKKYTEVLAAETTHMMLLAVAYLHSQDIAHRDLKLENFLYEDKEPNNMLKLIDFGFAKHWDRSHALTQACGSVHYVAPEVLRKSYDPKADCWSMGVIVYMLLTGSPPFHGTDDQVLQKIKEGSPHWGSRFAALSTAAREFLQGLLKKDPKERLSAQDALAHQFISQRQNVEAVEIHDDILKELRAFHHSAKFKQTMLSMMAWSLTVEDRKELRLQFLALDTEKTGEIKHQQMVNVLKEKFEIDHAEAEKLFDSLDTNNDGKINYSEFLAATLQGRVKAHEDVLRKTFMRFDDEGQGNINHKHLKDILGNSWEEVEIDELISEADLNNDGNISYDEFLAYFHKNDDGDAPIGDAPSPSPSSKTPKHVLNEKLAKVVDDLVDDGSALSPKTPNPLRKANSKQAKTYP